MATSTQRTVLGFALLLGACEAHDRVLGADRSPAMVSDAGDQHVRDAGQEAPESMDAGWLEPPPASGRDAGLDAGSTPHTQDPECDVNGLWIARQQTVNVALGLPQTANNWYFLQLVQRGEDVTVTDHFDCGIEVLGSVHAELARSTMEEMLEHNLQRNRRGTMRRAGASCELSLERFWSVRGADEATFLPASRSASLSLSELAAQRPIPSKNDLEGAVDWDDDGKPGIAVHISGVVSGVRNSVQRDYTRWLPDAEHPITPRSDFDQDLFVRTQFDQEESVLDPTSGLLTAGSTIDNSKPHRVTLRFLGRSQDDPRARALVKTAKLDTCFAIQAALPAAEL